MNIGITGYSGFIGSNLVRIFESKGYSVFKINLFNEYRIKLDVLSEINKIPIELDYVIHAAGNSNINISFANEKMDFDSNAFLVFEILTAIKNSIHRKSKILFLSSAAVYGNPDYLPIDINHKINPISPYGCSKCIAEEILKYYSKIYNLKYSILRIFSAYGENNKKQVFWDLCSKAISNNNNLLVKGSEYEVRDYIHIQDLFEQIFIVINNGNFSGEIYNCGNGIGITIKEVSNLIAKYFKVKNIQFDKKNVTGYPSKWIADISYFKNNRYNISINIENGILTYCDWFVKQYQDNV